MSGCIDREVAAPPVWEPYYRSRRLVRIDGRVIRYLDFGDGPVVLLLHGMGHSIFGWRYQVPALIEAGRRVIAIDTPGFGYSEAFPTPALESVAAMQAAVVAFLTDLLDTFVIPNCAVVGHSLGGAYATLLALERPDRVERLVLAAPALGPTVGLPVRMLALGLVRRRFRPTPGQVRLAFRDLMYHPELVQEEEIDEIVLALSRPGAGEFLTGLLRQGVGWRGMRPDVLLLPRLRTLRAQTLLLWGRHDKILPFRNAGRVAAEIPKVRLEVLEDSGHMLALEERARFNQLVIQFLRDGGAADSSPALGDLERLGARDQR